jgi:hypothetical protein
MSLEHIRSIPDSREHVGSSFIGWLRFQRLYDHIAQREPEMSA